ncbi:MAG: hypothetical protein MSIBF_01460 [Candidatus Altiarchaeales archaeon IMC4]|nr:MAG: hypothetical protein MSIBF_01460 [Candidatus Altiarchaeales archaeon IMC4]
MTIPSGVRSLMNLHKGDEMIIIAMENEMIIKPKMAEPLTMAGFLGSDDETVDVKGLIAKYER